MTRTKRIPGLLAICFAAFLLSSCSRVKIVYNHANLLLEHKAHQYLQLSPQADEKLSQEIKAYMAWHRKEMLPTYASVCRKMAQGFRGAEPEQDNIRLVTPMLSGVWADTVQPMIEPIARAMWSLDQKGIERLAQAYTADSLKQRQLYLDDPAEADRRRVRKTLDYVTMFAGIPDARQIRQITDATLAVHMPYEAWVTDRERRKRDLLELLRSHQSELLVEAALHDWWLRSRISGNRVLPGQLDLREVKQFFLRLTQILTPAQRENTARELESYAAEFDELASESPAPQTAP